MMMMMSFKEIFISIFFFVVTPKGMFIVSVVNNENDNDNDNDDDEPSQIKIIIGQFVGVVITFFSPV